VIISVSKPVLVIPGVITGITDLIPVMVSRDISGDKQRYTVIVVSNIFMIFDLE
jgi:hypothetical protein